MCDSVKERLRVSVEVTTVYASVVIAFFEIICKKDHDLDILIIDIKIVVYISGRPSGLTADVLNIFIYYDIFF